MPENIYDTSKVVHHLIYLIVPFAFNCEWEEAAVRLGKDGQWRPAGFSNQRLFNYVDDLFSNNEPNQILARYYRLEQKSRNRIGLPNNINTIMKLATGKGELAVSLTQIELFLFESRVGFLAYKLQMADNCSVNDIVDAAYYAKSFKRSEVTLNYERKTGKDSSQPMQIRIPDITAVLLEPLTIESFFENDLNSKGQQSPHHALVYSAVILDKKPADEEIAEILFRMRRSFKYSYKPASSEYDLAHNEESLQLFDNIYWGASLEGLSCLTYKLDDKVSNDFLNGTFMGYLENTYLFLYLLALHQRYGLISLAMEAAHLPSTLQEMRKSMHPEKYKTGLSKMVKLNSISLHSADVSEQSQISMLQEKISYFTLRFLFTQVSAITHHARLYKLMRQVMGINELLWELRLEIEALSAMAEAEDLRETQEMRLAERRQWESEKEDRRLQWKKEEDKQEQFQNFALIISTVFVFISTTQALWSMANCYWYKQYPAPGSNAFIGMLVCIAMMWFLVLGCAIWWWTRLRKTDDSINKNK